MKKVEAAQHRANASAFLSNNPGKHSTEEVAKHLNVTNRTAGQILLHMAKTGLISPMETAAGNKKLWSWPEGQTATEAPKAQRVSKPPKEVELVYGGVLVIIGKNEKTGRLRITLEEA